MTSKSFYLVITVNLEFLKSHAKCSMAKTCQKNKNDKLRAFFLWKMCEKNGRWLS